MKQKIVVGYEGNPNHGNALNWGAAAMFIDGKLVSSCMPNGIKPNADPEKELERFVKEGAVVATEVQIPLNDVDVYGFFVLDIAKELAEREPYNRPDEASVVHGIEVIATGTTRTYYVFTSYKLLRRWLTHLQASRFMLVPWGTNK